MQNKLFEVCCQHDPDPVEQCKRNIDLVKSGVDIHVTDKNGVTALHHAVRFRSPAAVKALIEQGANVNQACRRNGSTPLHRAVTQTGAPGTGDKSNEAREIVESLLAAGPDASVANKAQRTPGSYVKDKSMNTLLFSG